MHSPSKQCSGNPFRNCCEAFPSSLKTDLQLVGRRMTLIVVYKFAQLNGNIWERPTMSSFIFHCMHTNFNRVLFEQPKWEKVFIQWQSRTELTTAVVVGLSKESFSSLLIHTNIMRKQCISCIQSIKYYVTGGHFEHSKASILPTS